MPTFIKPLLYFLIAVIPVAIQNEKAPEDAWGWTKLIGASLLAGLIALKAFTSDPSSPN